MGGGFPKKTENNILNKSHQTTQSVLIFLTIVLYCGHMGGARPQIFSESRAHLVKAGTGEMGDLLGHLSGKASTTKYKNLGIFRKE